MPLSTAQKATVRRIANIQAESFLRIANDKLYETLIKELEEEGYDVSEADILEDLAKQLELWDDLKVSPEEFLNRLDDLNLSVLKHILLHEFELTQDTKGIWKKLNLFDKVNERKN